MNSNLLLSLLT